MDAAVIGILGVAVAWLWHRVSALEREVSLLRYRSIADIAERSDSEPSEPAADLGDPPAPLAEPAPPGPAGWSLAGWRAGFDFEEVFGRLLPIWAGGITLAVAGFFLVRWSIEAGLLTPPVRVVLAGLFGAALLAAAEAAYRWRVRIADPRVAQALAGAGLATLYFAFYLAGSTYGLIGSALAFVLLAGVTAAAIGLSFRFGLPSAVLGLVGGFAAPALVGSEDANLPLLTLYLALVTGGLAVTGRRQDRAWLGLAALAGGLGWGALLVGGDLVRAPEVAALGAYLVLLGGVIPALSGSAGGTLRWARAGAAGIAALQLAVLVGMGGFGALQWGLYLLLGAALAWFGWRDRAMREAGAFAAAVGTALLISWSDPGAAGFAAVAAGLAAVFAGPALARLWRGEGGALDVGQAAGLALGVAGAVYAHFAQVLPDAPRVLPGLALAALAVTPALAAHWAGRSGNRVALGWLWAAQAVAAAIGYGALAQVLPRDALAWAAGGLAILAAWRGATFAGALAALATAALLWAIVPLGEWASAGAAAVAGVPLRAEQLPSLRALLLTVAPAVAAAGAWRVFAPPGPLARRALAVGAVVGATIVLHTGFRIAFAALAGDDFTATGLIQRAAWEALLTGLGIAALVRGWRRLAAVLAGFALAHFGWFAAVLHNPLWTAQAVGALPLANALVPMIAAGLAALWLAARLVPSAPAWPRWVLEGAAMAIIALFMLSQLRQAFAGSLLTTTPVGQSEDLLRSLAGIVLAGGFLAWGTRSGRRSWRIGSLVAMVIAVLKVFLVDAAGLEGLGRIASFMALGFSLIGIGWFYNRQLRAPAAEELPTPPSR